MSAATLLRFVIFNLIGLQAYRHQGDAYVEEVFNCQSADPVVIPNSSSHLRTIELFSPCFPDDYRNCSYVSPCTVMLENIPANLWVRIFAGSLGQYADELAIHVNGELVRQANISTSFLYSSFLSRPSYISLTLDRRMSGPSDSSALFKVDIILANAMDRGPDTISAEDGYVVSHSTFDYGQSEENYYSDGRTTSLTLTGLNQSDKLHLTFLAFFIPFIKRTRWFSGDSYHCDDYLEIRNVRGYSDNRRIICGFDRPSANGTEYYPASTNITFMFVTRTFSPHQLSEHGGFLFHYKVVVNEDGCPPSIQKAFPAIPLNIGNTNMYLVRCEDGSWTQNRTKNQFVNCMNENWKMTFLPCVDTFCHLPALPSIGTLNFSMSFVGRATVGTNLTFFCDNQDQELSGNDVLTCTDDGTWDGELPTCITKAIEQESEPTPPPFNEKEATHGKEHPFESANKLMIGLCVGVTAAIILVLLVAFFIKRKQADTKRRNILRSSPKTDEEPEHFATTNAYPNGQHIKDAIVESVPVKVGKSHPKPPLAAPRKTGTTATNQLNDFYENAAVIREKKDGVKHDTYSTVVGPITTQLTLAELIENDLYHT